MTLTICKVTAMFPERPSLCGMAPPNRDGCNPITLKELNPIESTVSTVFADKFREVSEQDDKEQKPSIWTARMLANAACCPIIRFINPIPFKPSLPQVFHIEYLRGHARKETIYFHQCGPLHYLLPVQKPTEILALSAAAIGNNPQNLLESEWERVSRTLTCCLNDEQMQGVAITFEVQREAMTIMWLKQ